MLNRVYFEGKLPEVVIVIMSDKKAYGSITTRKIWKSADIYYYEINISAEHLNRESVRILCTLNHEACHLYCMENNIRDTSNRGRFHNRKFREVAEARGLKIENGGSIGWSVTSPKEEFIRTIQENGLDNMDISCYRTNGVRIEIFDGLERYKLKGMKSKRLDKLFSCVWVETK